ncbi:MAG: T9SS type A sorting domain-containing protein, partial [Flavobacteriaceae bacterium]|nr:T9SS type A sorting domain-containing protein [Flavobacteriaceae bacterium]
FHLLEFLRVLFRSYVADTYNQKIKKIGLDGTVTVLAPSEGFTNPYGVAVGADGTVYVADTFNHQIKKISAGTVLTGTAPTTAGTHNVTLTANDGNGGTATQSFTITVKGKPTVTVSEATAITANGATLNGAITADGGATITERGFIYAKTTDDATPTLAEVNGTTVVKVTLTGTIGSIAKTIENLEANTAYNFVVYATNKVGTSYGIVKNFETVSVLSVEDIIFSGLKVYPNPVRNTLHIKGQRTIDKITITNLLGQKIIERKNDTISLEIDFSNLKSGLYLLKVQAENKSKVYKIYKRN